MPPGESRYSRLHAVLTQDHQSPFLLSGNLCYFAIRTEFDHLDIRSYHLPPSHTTVPPFRFSSMTPHRILDGHRDASLNHCRQRFRVLSIWLQYCCHYAFDRCFSEHTSIITTPPLAPAQILPQLSPRYASRTNEKGHEM